jgi:hypothetical protein
MKKLILYLFLFSFGVFSLTSCGGKEKKSGKKASSGGPNEMLIITQNAQQWKGEMGDSIRAEFGKSMAVLSIPEPEFSLVNVQAKSLEKPMFKTHHNLFILNLNKKFDKPFIEIRKDLWAQPQMIVKINAPDHESFLHFFEANKHKAMELFRENERSRIIKSYASKFKNINVVRDLRKNFGLEMNVPKGYHMAVLQKNFAWIRKETTTNSMDLLVYTAPYSDTSDFNPQKIRQRRNLLTKVKIPGPTEQSFVKIADEYIPLQSRKINFNGLYATELRGLWDLENDFMGGPFISYTFYDETNSRVVTVDGFMYAPKQKKAVMMRELEAILWSTKLIKN